MSEQNRQSQETSEETGFDIAVEIKKIQTHLGFLEKKLDMLVAQAQERGGGGGHRPQGRDFRPRRDFRGGGDFNRRDRGEGGGGFKRREGGEGGGGFKRREGGFDRERGGEGRGGNFGGGGHSGGGDRPFRKRRRPF